MTSEKESSPPVRPFPGQVIQVLAYGLKLVVNRGAEDGVKNGSRFLVYALSDEDIVDPESGESLGRLEIVRGRAVATHVQARMATIEPESTKFISRRVVKPSPTQSIVLGRGDEIIEEPTFSQGSFDDPQVGDRVKPI